jgi:hypothetical protein
MFSAKVNFFVRKEKKENVSKKMAKKRKMREKRRNGYQITTVDFIIILVGLITIQKTRIENIVDFLVYTYV